MVSSGFLRLLESSFLVRKEEILAVGWHTQSLRPQHNAEGITFVSFALSLGRGCVDTVSPGAHKVIACSLKPKTPWNSDYPCNPSTQEVEAGGLS